MNETNDVVMNEDEVMEYVDDPCDPEEHNWMVLAIGGGLATLIGAGIACRKKIRSAYVNRLRKLGYDVTEPEVTAEEDSDEEDSEE